MYTKYVQHLAKYSIIGVLVLVVIANGAALLRKATDLDYTVAVYMSDWTNYSVAGVDLYQELAATDPLFALPGTDLVLIREILQQLTDSKTLLADQVAPEQFERIDRVLYPDALWQQLVATEEARRALLDAPDANHITTYHQRLMELFTEYDHTIAMMVAELQHADTATQLVLYPGRTSIDRVIQELERARQELEHWVAIEQQRYLCLYGAIVCDTSTIRLHDDTYERQSENSFPSASPELVSNWRQHASYVHRYYEQTDQAAPIYLMHDSQCVPRSHTQPYVLSSFTSRVNALPAVAADAIHELYFIEIQPGSEQTKLVEQHAAHGYAYQWQSISPYHCLDFAYDQTSLRFTEYAIEVMKEHDLPHTYSHTSSTAPDLIRVSAVAMSVDQSLYTDADVTPEQQDALHELSLLQRTRSYGTEALLGLIDDMMYTNFSALGEAYWTHRPLELFLIDRSYFGAFLLFHNDTVPGRVGHWYHENEVDVAYFNMIPYQVELSNTITLEHELMPQRRPLSTPLEHN